MKNKNKIYTSIYTYKIEQHKKFIMEQALYKKQQQKSQRFINAGDVKGLEKHNKELIIEIGNILKELDVNDIKIYYDDKSRIIINYTSRINDILTTIKNNSIEIDKLNDDTNLAYKYFGTGLYTYDLEVEIDEDDLNQIHVINELPSFMRGFGLGTKIYLRLINEFNYISTNNKHKPTNDSSKVWINIISDKNYYSFMNGDNFITFKKELDKEYYLHVLGDFYQTEILIELDNDFLNDFNLTKDDILNN